MNCANGTAKSEHVLQRNEFRAGDLAGVSFADCDKSFRTPMASFFRENKTRW